MLMFRVIGCILLLIPLSLIGCSNRTTSINSREYYDAYRREVQSHEWVNLRIKNYTYRGILITFRHPEVQLICHNTDENSATIFYFSPDFRMMINKDSVVYINDDYNEIAIYSHDSIISTSLDTFSYYSFLVGMMMKQTSMLGTFSPFIEEMNLLSPCDTTMYVSPYTRTVRVPGRKVEKICTPTMCYLVEDPCQFVFDRRLGNLKYSEETTFNRHISRRKQSVKKITYDDVDSSIFRQFDISATRYDNYSKQINDSCFLMSVHTGYVGDTLPQSVSYYPLVNMYHHDTIRLNDVAGKKLLLLWKTREEYAQCVSISRRMQKYCKCFLINCVTNNIDYLRAIVSGRSLKDTYYAKGLSMKLDFSSGYYIISSTNQVITKSESLSLSAIKNSLRQYD